MADETPLSVVFFWHQHQPYYKDRLTNHYELPWVRLHAIKDYYDMVAILDEFPAIRLNFNLVPSLLAQLEDYASGSVQDRFLTVSAKSASTLTQDDKLFILENFFMANWDRMIQIYPRYRELLDKRGRTSLPEDRPRLLAFFKEQDWRDLQVWFNLTWFDPLWDEKEPFIKDLKKKGKGFTEDEKKKLLDKQLWICGQVAAKHKEVAARGQVELTTTPFYHPILPLLCDTESAQEALPQIRLPDRFQHAQDARHQIQSGIARFEKTFGFRPKGMWPSEGSVSMEALGLLAAEGIQWAATDEGVLANSLGAQFSRDRLYQPYRVNLPTGPLQMIFRDHELSDAIGFVYASWNTDQAVEDFIKKLIGIRDRALSAGITAPLVSIILDGENCWEYYDQDGLPFLRKLYAALSTDPRLKTVRVSDFLADHPATTGIERVAAGSWINRNFAIWIGHPEDNRAWNLLQRTRSFLTAYLEKTPHLVGSQKAEEAWESIYIAEGSDWCWWYGDDHSSANDGVFDFLFRKNLMNVYTVLGVPIPEDLFVAIKSARKDRSLLMPVGFISPKIDGKKTSYYEWHSAGVYTTEAGETGTMHRAENKIQNVYFGFDASALYLRLDWTKPLTAEERNTLSLVIHFISPEGVLLKRPLNAELPWSTEMGGASFALQKIAEVAIPLAFLKGNAAPATLEWTIAIEGKGGVVEEKWPQNSAFRIPWPAQDAFADQWSTL